MSELSLYNCWTCKKKLSDEQPEEFFFWCDKECYDKDDTYHNRRKIAESEPEVEAKPIQEETATKQERKRKIREVLGALSTASSSSKKKSTPATTSTTITKQTKVKKVK
ncbi:MAG: hypothetical protein WC761_01500 [Candidatus Paceibacterota bacterium]|jgi:hypothetical protein